MRHLLFLRRRADVPAGELRRFVTETLEPAWAGSPEVLKLRRHLFEPLEATLDHPGVVLYKPPELQYQAAVEVVVADEDALARFAASPAFTGTADGLAATVRASTPPGSTAASPPRTVARSPWPGCAAWPPTSSGGSRPTASATRRSRPCSCRSWRGRRRGRRPHPVTAPTLSAGRLEVAGVATAVIDTGTPAGAAAPPALLLHGSGPGVTATANWRTVIPALLPSPGGSHPISSASAERPPAGSAPMPVIGLFAHDRDLITDELVELRYRASVDPPVRDSWAAMFPQPRQRWWTTSPCPAPSWRRSGHRS